MKSPAVFAGNRPGFTLIEILIVIGIFGILAVASFPLYSNMQVQSARQSAADDVADSIRVSIAQFRSDGVSRGVFVEPHAVTSFTGSTYITRDVLLDRRVELSDAIELTSTFFENEIRIGSIDSQFPSGSVTITDTITNRQETVRLTPLGIVLYE